MGGETTGKATAEAMSEATNEATNEKHMSAYERANATASKFSKLRAIDGRVLVDMRQLWCGWLYLGFAGDSPLSQESSDEVSCEVMPIDIDGRDGLLAETAYYSTVFRDLCSDLVRHAQNPHAEASQEILIFCEAEERGNYEVRLTTDKVSICDYADDTNDKVEVCSVSRSDGGSYVRDCIGAIASLGRDILSAPDGSRNDALEALSLFCEGVGYDAEGEPYAIDATSEDAEAILRKAIASYEAMDNSSAQKLH